MMQCEEKCIIKKSTDRTKPRADMFSSGQAALQDAAKLLAHSHANQLVLEQEMEVFIAVTLASMAPTSGCISHWLVCATS